MKYAWRSRISARNIPWYPQNIFNKFHWPPMILFSDIFRGFNLGILQDVVNAGFPEPVHQGALKRTGMVET